MNENDIENENIDFLQVNAPAESVDSDEPVRAQIIIRRKRAKSRIDKYLQQRFNRFSRTGIQKLVKEGAITVNGKIVKPSYEILPGDEINLILPPLDKNEIVPEDIPLEILYEDKYIAAVNKPANMVVHPAKGYQSGTLVHAMAWHCKHLSNAGDPVRPGIVHRLDKDTTGVILFAKDDEAHWRLAMQFERRQIHKEYLAVVEGRIELDSDKIDAPIGPHAKFREKYAVRPEIGRQSVTVYQVIERLKKFTFVRFLPQTGRTHQLRVHSSSLKHPIVRDTMYGARIIRKGELFGTDDDSPIIDRFALHAHKIHFRHPITGKEMQLEATPPDDFKNLLDILREYAGK